MLDMDELCWPTALDLPKYIVVGGGGICEATKITDVTGEKVRWGDYWNNHALSAVESDGKSKQDGMMTKTNLKAGVGGCYWQSSSVQTGQNKGGEDDSEGRW